MFALSGAAALGFEVLWARQLARVLGGSTTSVAFVVALFMGGMGAGYAWGGRLAPRLKRPVMAYGIAEIGIGVLAITTVHILPTLEGSSVALAYVASAALILPCTFLAGATLPFLVESTRGALGVAVGRLYAVNTFGAVVGVLVVGTWSIGAVGIRLSGWGLTTLGVVCGSIACWIGREPRTPSEREQAQPWRPGAMWLVLSTMVGVASLAEEVLWTRALTARFNASTYALSAILAVFLLGLAGGAAIAARLVRGQRNIIAWLAASQVVAGAIVMVTPELLVGSEFLIPGYVGVAQVGAWSTWIQTLGLGLARTTLVLLPPTLLLGLALPLIAHLYAQQTGLMRGRAAGRISAANAIGAVLGSLGARFVLLPLVGLGNGLRAMAALHAIVALALIVALRDKLPRGARPAYWFALPLALIVGVVARPQPEPLLGRLAEGHRTIFVDEGVQDTTAVVEVFDGSRHIFSNGVAYAGDQGDARRYMRALGHLPSIRARRQQRALVICLGTGMTAAAVARHPFEQIDLVDISPVVHQTLPYFERVNDRVFEDPRVTIHIQDGRVFMARAPSETYDVVTLEPPPPRASGVAALYSVEFYRSAKRLLRDGGVVAQWLPLHGMSYGELRMLARTFFEVFPQGEVVELLDNEAGLLATVGDGAPQQVQTERAAEVREHFEPPLDLLSLRRSEVEFDGEIVTDDVPRIEHFVRELANESPDDAAARFSRNVFD